MSQGVSQPTQQSATRRKQDIKTRNQNKKSITLTLITATINNNHREIIAHLMLMKQ